MEISDFLKPENTLVGLRVRDKAQLITDMARRAGAALQRDSHAIEAALTARERLGSTGLGRGFALPHARLPDLPGFYGVFGRLARPVDFQAIDEQPVDLVFLLLIPEQAGNGHVTALAAISRRMRDAAFAGRLRKAGSASEAYKILAQNAA